MITRHYFDADLFSLEISLGAWLMCWMWSKRYSCPSLDDRWEFCWDRVLDAKECGDDEENWTRYIFHQWPIFQNFLLWPKPKHNVVLCVLWHMVHFIICGRTALSFQDYIDFMKRVRWKITRGENGCRNMGTTWTCVHVVGDTVGTWRLRMTNSSWIFCGVMEGVVLWQIWSVKNYRIYVQR